jgi:hypothetical protein
MSAAFLRLWGAPLLLALLSLAGLLTGLLGDGVWDWLSAGLLAVPVAVAAWFGLRQW